MPKRERNRSSKSVFQYITGNVILAISISMVLNMFLLGQVAWQVLYPKERDYYITYNKKRDQFLTNNWRDTSVLKVKELHEPNQSDTSVVQWANEAIIDLYSYDFYNYRQQIYEKKRFFTSAGWTSFLAALKSSNIIKEIREKKLRVSAIVVKPALLQRKGPLLGVYSWSVKLPVLVNFESASESKQQKYLATVVIQRRSPLFDPKGVGIASFTIKGKGT